MHTPRRKQAYQDKMSQCNLSYIILQKHLQRLVDQDLVTVVVGEFDKRTKKYYHITQKGVRIVQYANMPEFNKAITLARTA